MLRERRLTNFVSADAGGIGGPMCAQLSSDFGINATRVNNGSPPRKKDEFANVAVLDVSMKRFCSARFEVFV
jgi:hypothetical protein